MTTINLATYMVRYDDGALDLDATVEKFRGDVLKHQAERETEEAVIRAAVDTVFDQYRGTRIHMPALQSLALQNLNVQPENFETLRKRVAEYVRENASGERSDGKLFKIGKGKNGGVTRWADTPLTDAEKKAAEAESSDAPESDSDSE